MIDRLAIDCTATKPTEKRRKGHARKRIQAPLAPPPGARGPHPLTGHHLGLLAGGLALPSRPSPTAPAPGTWGRSRLQAERNRAPPPVCCRAGGVGARGRRPVVRSGGRHVVRMGSSAARHRGADPQPPPPGIARVTSLATTGRRPSQPNIPRTAGRGPASSAGGTARPVGPSPSGRGALPRTVGFRRRARCLCLCRLQGFSSRRYGLIMSLVRGGAGGLPVSPSGYAGIAHT
ncbi:hypothetical protein GQ55_2G314000 [Panicum hallii var. hallii]|uniref:Uncharacterized protein n=1 Tax=Panicum hallii var. hallii TaxID=1504633 RepID=A0A2T7EUE0_9POAL|nr:hypothetical protein GQ55_2G314000 [Panicum hallii var. hallii]